VLKALATYLAILPLQLPTQQPVGSAPLQMRIQVMMSLSATVTTMLPYLAL